MNEDQTATETQTTPCTCGAGNTGWMNHDRKCPVRIDAETRSIEERGREALARHEAHHVDGMPADIEQMYYGGEQ